MNNRSLNRTCYILCRYDTFAGEWIRYSKHKKPNIIVPIGAILERSRLKGSSSEIELKIMKLYKIRMIWNLKNVPAPCNAEFTYFLLCVLCFALLFALLRFVLVLPLPLFRMLMRYLFGWYPYLWCSKMVV